MEKGRGIGERERWHMERRIKYTDEPLDFASIREKAIEELLGIQVRVLFFLYADFRGRTMSGIGGEIIWQGEYFFIY